MILPTKHIKPQDCLLGVGATLLPALGNGKTVTELWDESRPRPGVVSFERFALGLDLLFAMGLIEISGGFIKRVAP